MQPIQQLPTEQGTAGDLARQLAVLLGPAHQPADGTLIAADLLALGGALAGARNTNTTALNEAFATSVSQLLSETEVIYGLTARPELADAARQTRLLAKIRAARAGSPQGILRSIRTYDSTAALYEVSPSDITPRTNDGLFPGSTRDVYHFIVVISTATYNDSSKRSEIANIIEQMKPAYDSYILSTVVPGWIMDGSQFDIDTF